MTRDQRWAANSGTLPIVIAAALTAALILVLTSCSTLDSPQPNSDSDQTTAQAGLTRSGRPLQAAYRNAAGAQAAGWDAERLRVSGDLWREAGYLTEAAADWEAALLLDPQNVGLARDLALVYLERERWHQALSALDRLLALTPEDTWARLQRGLIHTARNSEAALADLRAAAAEPAYAALTGALIAAVTDAAEADDGAVRVGLALADADLWPQAELAFERAWSDTTSARVAAYLGWSRDRQVKDGSAMIARAAATAPQDAQVRYLQALHLRHVGDFAASLRAMIQAVALDANSPLLYAELGAAYQLTGDVISAEHWLARAVEFSGGDPRFQALLDQIGAGEQQMLAALGLGSLTEIDAQE
jgi:tetratricopeptide (TPR) repeat protein